MCFWKVAWFFYASCHLRQNSKFETSVMDNRDPNNINEHLQVRKADTLVVGWSKGNITGTTQKSLFKGFVNSSSRPTEMGSQKLKNIRQEKNAQAPLTTVRIHHHFFYSCNIFSWQSLSYLFPAHSSMKFLAKMTRGTRAPKRPNSPGSPLPLYFTSNDDTTAEYWEEFINRKAKKNCGILNYDSCISAMHLPKL